ncbi:SET domain-containing protein [Spongorhabdus nitratireducens]
MRSLQEFPVSLNDGTSFTLLLYARAKRPGTVKLKLKIKSLIDQSSRTMLSHPDEGFCWHLTPHSLVHLKLSGRNLKYISVRETPEECSPLPFETVLPVTHEIALDSPALDWLEELVIFITSRKTILPEQCQTSIHLMGHSGMCYQNHVSSISLMEDYYRPGFFSILVHPAQGLAESQLSRALCGNLLEWMYSQYQRPLLNQIFSAEPFEPQSPCMQISPLLSTVHVETFEQRVERLEQAVSATSPLPLILPGSPNLPDEHRYYTGGPVYPSVSEMAEKSFHSCGQGLTVNLLGEMIKASSEDRAEIHANVESFMLEGLRDQNSHLNKLTYPALILDTDARGALAGQLGLFARQDIPAFMPLGAYGGMLCHKQEQSILERHQGAAVMDYCHTTGHQKRKLLIINPYQVGNLLSLCNTDRLVEHQIDPDHPRNLEKLAVISNQMSYIVFVSKRVIKKNSELFIDYGSEFQKRLLQRQAAIQKLKGDAQLPSPSLERHSARDDESGFRKRKNEYKPPFTRLKKKIAAEA